MDTRTYVVTERAGPKVAGLVVKRDEEIHLTEAEAAAELLAGTIVPKGKNLPKAFAEDSPKLRRMRAAARGEDLVEPEDPPPAPQAPAAGAPPPPPADPATPPSGSTPPAAQPSAETPAASARGRRAS